MTNKTLHLASDHALGDNFTSQSAAWLSLAAYFRPEHADEELKERFLLKSEVFHIHSKDLDVNCIDTELFVAVINDTLVISVRGSEPSSWIDWVKTDLNTTQVPALGIGKTDSYIHAGFMVAASSVWKEVAYRVKKLFKSHSPKKVLIAGHSLGGAIAVVTASTIIKNAQTDKVLKSIIPLLEVHAFGAPRVGNEAFSKWYNRQLGDRTFSHVYYMDIVPRIPPKDGLVNLMSSDWAAVGEQRYYNKSGEYVSGAPEVLFDDLKSFGYLNPIKLRRAAYSHLPWLYAWATDGLVNSSPKMSRKRETLYYLALFGTNAITRIIEDIYRSFDKPESDAVSS